MGEKNLFYFFAFCLIFSIGILNALDSSFIFKQDDSTVNITLQVLNTDNSVTTASSICTLTVKDKDLIIRKNDENMSYIGNGYFTLYVGDILDKSGLYSATLNCEDNTGNFLASNFVFDVTPTGEDINGTRSQYGVLLALILIIFFITCYGAYAIPFNNNRDEEGKVISINDLKYLKVVCVVFAYLEFVFIISIAKNMALGFSLNGGIYEFFNVIYVILMSSMLVFFPLIIFFSVVIWINDKKTQKAIARGIDQW